MSVLAPTNFPLVLPELTAAPPVSNPALGSYPLAPDGSWWLGGRRVHAEFAAAHGVQEVTFGSAGSIRRLVWSETAVAVAAASPRTARFDRALAGGGFSETIRIPERLPGLVVELRCGDGSPPDMPVVGRLELAFPGTPIQTAGDIGARWFHAEGGDGILIVALDVDGRVDALGEPRGTEGGITLPVTIGAGALPATLLILAGPPSAASLRSLAATRAHERRAPPPPEALRLREPTGLAATAMEWAWTRVRDRALDSVGPRPELHPDDAAAWVRTSVSCGLPRAARAALASEPTSVADVDAWGAWAACVGGGGPLDELQARVGRGEHLPGDVRRGLAGVADRAGSDVWASELRSAEAAESGRVPLPSVSEMPDEPQRLVDGGADGPAERWLTRIESDPAALGAGGWRVLGDLVDDVLGWSPDAASGRMHLTPSLPEGWPRFALEGLRGGELRMRLERMREGDVERWRFEPMAGAVPATLILRLPIPDESTVIEVDGVVAELDHELVDGVLRAPIQLQLDRERVVRVRRAPEDGASNAGRITLPTL